MGVSSARDGRGTSAQYRNIVYKMLRVSDSSTECRYRGRIAPSPTGLLHVGHARTFWRAAQRAAERRGTLVLRNEDLDPQRCQASFVAAMLEDLRWLGI